MGRSGQTPLRQPQSKTSSHLDWEQKPRGLPRTTPTCALSLPGHWSQHKRLPSGAGRGREGGWVRQGALHKVPRALCCPPAHLSACSLAGDLFPKLGQAVLKALSRAWDPSLWDQRVRKAIPSWYQELCPALVLGKSKIPGRGLWACGYSLPRGSVALVDPAEGHLVEQGA